MIEWRTVDLEDEGYGPDDSIRFVATIPGMLLSLDADPESGYYLRVNDFGSGWTWTLMLDGSVINESGPENLCRTPQEAMVQAENALANAQRDYVVAHTL